MTSDAQMLLTTTKNYQIRKTHTHTHAHTHTYRPATDKKCDHRATNKI